MQTFFKFIYNIVSWLFLGIILIVAFFTIGSNTNFFGSYKSFMVLSGSMEPAIMIGDIIVTKSQNQYLKNDVITFYGEEGRVITHRIASISPIDEQTEIITKGDANRSEDDANISEKSVIGKVIFVVPKLGYLINFARSIPGLIIFIFVPTIALIIDQILKLTKK